MALIDKLTAIANAIRGKTGKAEEMTLDQMVTEIEGIEAGGGGADHIDGEGYGAKYSFGVVTIGANTVKNALQAREFFCALSGCNITSFFGTMDEPTVENQQVFEDTKTGRRLRGGAVGEYKIGLPSYDLVLPEGARYFYATYTMTIP